MFKTILDELIKFLFCVTMFYFISTPIFDILFPNIEDRFNLIWTFSIITTIFFRKLDEINDNLKKINKKDE